jgi:acyl dehydratase
MSSQVIAPRYFDELTVGETRTAGPIEVTEEESIAFAKRYDPQIMHTDPEISANGPFGGIIASGWMTCALVMRLTIQAKMFGSTLVLGLGVDELRWPTPVRPGDNITAEYEVVSIVPSKSKPDFGVVRVKTTARNQKDEVVLSMITSIWVPKTPK